MNEVENMAHGIAVEESAASFAARPDTPPEARPVVLEIDRLAVSYQTRGGENEAIRDVSLQIRQGESFGVVGESGCGKSTLAWSIVGFLGRNGAITRGSIRFMGEPLSGRPESELRRLRGNRIAMVYQDPMQALNPSMRIGAQMKEVLTVHQKIEDGAAEERCLAMLRRIYMPDPEDVFTRYPHQLSGGQQQRVVIGMALLNNPALLIMDEPTTALDVTVEAAVLDLVADLRRDFDTAILYITHNLGVVARVCSRVGVMYAGEMVERASVRPLFAQPQHPYTQGLLRCIPQLSDDKNGAALYPIPGRVPRPDQRPAACLFAPRCAYARERCAAEAPDLRPLGNGSFVRCHFAEEIDPSLWTPPAEVESAPAKPLDAGQAHGAGEPLLRVRGLEKHYPVRSGGLRGALGWGEEGAVRAVDGVSFTLPRGRTLGIVGESGCGKSTLVKTIIGLEKASGGEIEFLGVDVTGDLSERSVEAIRELQMVFQNPDSTMNPAYTVGRQIARPMRRFRTVPRHRIRDEVIRLLRAVRLGAAYYDRLPRQLSGGEKQRVGIARALASRPELVLCDEPVSALDVSVQAAILNLLLEVQAEQGATLLFIAHDLSAVRYISDTVAVMYLGKLMEIGPAQAIYSPPSHPYTEALLSAVPIPDPTARQAQIRLGGSVPSALDPPPGCPFHTRCPRRSLAPNGGAICAEKAPPWQDAGDGHHIYCHIPLETLRSLEKVVTSPGASHAAVKRAAAA